MFKYEPEAERQKYGPHRWMTADLGHSNTVCRACGGTPREIEVIGDMNHCEKSPPAPNTKD